MIRKVLAVLGILIALFACAGLAVVFGPQLANELSKAMPTPQVIEKEVEVIKEVEVEKIVEVEVPYTVTVPYTETVYVESEPQPGNSGATAAGSTAPEPEKVANTPYFEVWINDHVCTGFDAQPEGVKLGKGGTVYTMGDSKGSANSNDWEDSLCVRGTTEWGTGTFALKFHVRDVEFSIDFANPVEVRVREVGTLLSNQPLTKPTPAPEVRVEESPAAAAAVPSPEAPAPTATPEPVAVEMVTITITDLPYNFEKGGDRAKFVSDVVINQIKIVGKESDGKGGDGSDSFYQTDESGSHIGEALMGGGAAGRWVNLAQPGTEFYLEAREVPGAILADVK